jgi:hypothetical protein
MKAASQEINSIGGRFGFTPSDRAKVKIDQQPAEKSALAKLMSAN